MIRNGFLVSSLEWGYKVQMSMGWYKVSKGSRVLAAHPHPQIHRVHPGLCYLYIVFYFIFTGGKQLKTNVQTFA